MPEPTEHQLKAASRVIHKWMRKGNMSRALRDVLPVSKLGPQERQGAADMVHAVVRYWRWYTYVLERLGRQQTPEEYLALAMGKTAFDGPALEAQLDAFQKLAIRQSFSDEAAEALNHGFIELADYLNQEPQKALCTNLIKGDRDSVLAMLKTENINGTPGLLDLTVIADDNARYSKAVQEGYAHVQDESSQLVSRIASSLGKDILDYCAGSGGKTLAIASITKGSAKLTAHDKDAKKLEVLRDRAKKHGANVEIMSSDPTREFDVVLVDAPCSGLGASRRNPEAKFMTEPERFPMIQAGILQGVSGMVKRGGFLIYSVCTFLPNETENLMREFMKLGTFAMEDPKPFGLPESGLTHTVLPGGDVLYVAVLKKN